MMKKRRSVYSLQSTVKAEDGRRKTEDIFQKGFTLVEMLVVITLLAVFGVLILTIFTRTLRGGNKSQIIETIKQNGQIVLETMDKTIRNSDNVVCVSNLPDPGSTIVVVNDGIYTRYRFIAPDNGNTNGFIQQDNPVQPTPPSLESDIKVFTDNVCGDLMSSANIITDTNPQTGISIKSVTFTKSTSAGFKDTVTIQFQVAPGEQAQAAVAGQIDPVSFQTTIQLR